MKMAVMFFLIFVGLLSERAFAHSFAYYASTPITPPVEFRWWFPISMFLLVLGTYLPLRMSLKWSHLFSILSALLWVAAFTVVFYLIGCAASAASTGPEPGLGSPCPTYWGRTFAQVGDIFLFWNCFGLCLFMVGPLFFLLKDGKQDRTPRTLIFWSWLVSIVICYMLYVGIFGFVLFAAGLLYLLFKAGKRVIETPKRLAFWLWFIPLPLCFTFGLTPYIVTGAWIHGWGGGHVTRGCQNQIGDLHYALVMYALDHDNRLPVAKDYAELYPQIEPYMVSLDNKWHWHDRNGFCMIGEAFERSPKPFIWNVELSGKEVFQGDVGYGSEVTDPVVDVGNREFQIVGSPWVNCPYCPMPCVWEMGDVRNTNTEKLERLRKYQPPKPE
jgi:hypothetical protein